MKAKSGNTNSPDLISDLTPLALERAIPGAQHFSVWLVPSQNDYSLFAKTIERLANQYNAPAFEPHVTVYTGVHTQVDNLEKIVAESVQTIRPISLVVRGISFSDEFFKTLFIEFQDNVVLTALSQGVRSKLQYREHYNLRPHLSLMYKSIPEKQKRVIVDQLNLAKSQVHFDGVAVVSPGSFSKGWTDVEKWEVRFRRGLVGPAQDE